MGSTLSIPGGSSDRARRPHAGPASPDTDYADYLLTWLVQAFDQAQRHRMASASQLRAVLQGRTGPGAPDMETAEDVERALTEISRGVDVERVPVLGPQYARAVLGEHELQLAVCKAVRGHCMWSWLKNVRGIGELLGARLLANLSIDRARHPASFWAFCGLGTVASHEYSCARCGGTTRAVAGSEPPPRHRAPDKSWCPGVWHRSADATEVRIAQRHTLGTRTSLHSAAAKQTCYLIGVSFTRQGTAYRELYDRYRDEIDARHPEWAPKRRYLTALRFTEKRFLVHLWVVWRSMLGQPVPGDEFALTLAEAWSMADGQK